MVLAMVAAMSMAACGGDDDDGAAVCGDNACTGGETNATCPRDCPAGQVCGDGVCSGNETTASCAVDCPANPTCGDGTCSGQETTASCPGDCPCTDNTTGDDTCSGENVCINGACVNAFGRNYHIVIFNGQMTQNNAAGETWDAAGGLPDPLVSVTLNGTLIGSTSTQQDTLTPQWNEYLTAVIPGGSTFRVDVLDEDLTVDDPMFACATLPTLSAANIRAYVNTCSSAAGTPAGPGSSIAFWFEAQ
ncbi:MAG: hypothetical protein KC464_26965 [Myxococcales bacterium]|nr:hypothetical protein [Myxococcales bacterium]